MRHFFILLTILSSIAANCQSDEENIKAVINKMFAAMKAGDGELLKSTFSDNAVLQTVGHDKTGKVIIENDAVADFAALVSQLKKDSADERISFETIKSDGQLAIVWAPYNFYFNGKFSHCGIDSFQLVWLDNAWKIQYLIDTRRKSGCNP